MYAIKSNRKTNSYTVRKINRITQVVRVGRRGLQGETGPQGPKGPKGDKGEPGDGLVESVNGKQGVVVLNATDVGADPTGSASQALQDAKDYTDTEVSTLDSSLATVAKTGSYSDLSNKPTIPSIAGLATEAQVQDVQDNLDAHEADTANPHSVTKAQVGLGNVDNTSDANKQISTSTQTALNAKADLVNGKVPEAQLPSFVDDVLSFNSQANFPATGEDGKIYIAKDTNLTYRWTGSAYTEISQSLALGETVSTAYRGDRGKTAYDHTLNTNNPHGVTKAQVGLGNVDNLAPADMPVSTDTQTALDGKQDTLVSGTNIKTINSTSILGSGDIVISGGGGSSPELLGKYVHSGNLVAQPTAVDLETGVFTCVSHGLTTGDLVFPRFNTLRNTPLLAVFPGGLTATELTVTVLTPDTFTVGISPFTSVGTMDLGAWAFERYVRANNFHRVTLAAPVTSCRVVAYGINGTRYIKSDGFPSGTNPWVAGGVITDKFGSVNLGTASEVAFFLEYSARYVGNMVLLNGRKLTIGVGSVTANTITSNIPMSNTVSSTPTVPTSFGWFGFDNGRVFNGNTIEVWDR